MSGTTGAAPQAAVLSLDIDGPWHHRAVQKSKALVRTYLLSRSVVLPPPAGGSRGTKTPLRLPSLVSTAKGPHRRSNMAPLSLSEPSLLTLGEKAIYEGFSCNRCPSVSQKRATPPTPVGRSSPPIPCKSYHPSKNSQPHQNQHQARSYSRPAYIRISQPVQLCSKPAPVRRHSHNPSLSAAVIQGDLQPLVMPYRRHSLSQGEPLSIVGKPCLPSCSPRPAPPRTQLHVFLPTEGEGEEGDSESVDEGFMDELDSKITSLKLQQKPKETPKKPLLLGP